MLRKGFRKRHTDRLPGWGLELSEHERVLLFWCFVVVVIGVAAIIMTMIAVSWET